MLADPSLTHRIDEWKSNHTTPPSGASLSPADGCFRAIWAASLTDRNWPASSLIVPGPGIFGKQLQLLKEAIPHASRVAILWNPTDPGSALQKRAVEAAGRSLGMRLQHLETRGPEDFDHAFAAMARERAEGLLFGGSSTFLVYRTRIAELAVKGRLPTMHNFREMVEAGGLMAYAINMTDFIGRAAVYVDKILKGTKPAYLPVEQPTKFELVINLKTAKALGLTIPQSVLARADDVIQ